MWARTFFGGVNPADERALSAYLNPSVLSLKSERFESNQMQIEVKHTCLRDGGGELGFSIRGQRVGDNLVPIADSMVIIQNLSGLSDV